MDKVINFVIVLMSTLAALLFIDLFVFKPLIPHLSLGRMEFLDRPLRILGQTSKNNLMPEKPYIAITGDSFAQGKGDWLITSDDKITPPPPYQASDILHKMLGMDVISTGRGRSDSVASYSINLPDSYDYFDRLWFYKPLAEPDIVLLYFYAGNDLDDSMDRLKRFYDPEYDRAKIYDRNYFRSWMATHAKQRSRYNVFVNFTSALYIGRVGEHYIKSIKNFFRHSVDEIIEENTSPCVASPPDWTESNVIRLNERLVELGKGLQNRNLSLSREEIDLGLYMFDEALYFACEKFPHSRKAVVYIPPIMDCYNIVSPYVFEEEAAARFPTSKVREIGRYLERKISDLSIKNKCLFINTTPSFQDAGSRHIINGTIDIKHLNKYGYHVLAQSIADGLHQAGWVDTVTDYSYLNEDEPKLEKIVPPQVIFPGL